MMRLLTLAVVAAVVVIAGGWWYFHTSGPTRPQFRTVQVERGPLVAVVSYRYWERHLGLNPEIVGHVIFANGRAVTIVGILPREFVGIEPGSTPDLYLPMAHVGLVGNKHLNRQDTDTAWVQIIGRLRLGASEQAALAELSSMMQRDGEANARERETTGRPWRPVLEEGARGIKVLRDHSLPTLLILSSVVRCW